MKYLNFPGKEPVPMLDKSYTTNIQFECRNKLEALNLIESFAEEDWTSFSISRGGNETGYEGYTLEAVVIDLGKTCIVHFILKAPAQTNALGTETEYAQAARILMGESV